LQNSPFSLIAGLFSVRYELNLYYVDLFWSTKATPISLMRVFLITKLQLCYLRFVSTTRQIREISETTRNGSVKVQSDVCSSFERHKEMYPLFHAAVSGRRSVTSCFGGTSEYFSFG